MTVSSAVNATEIEVSGVNAGTVLVTDTGYEILTQSAGTPPPPAFVQPQTASA